jgi:transposase
MHLSPYSPELNPVELLWREVRRKYFHNTIFTTLDQVEATLQTALAQCHLNKKAIKQLAKGFIQI